MVEQDPLDAFVKYVDSKPMISKEEYVKTYKNFILGLGLTTAGYFIYTEEFS